MRLGCCRAYHRGSDVTLQWPTVEAARQNRSMDGKKSLSWELNIKHLRKHRHSCSSARLTPGSRNEKIHCKITVHTGGCVKGEESRSLGAAPGSLGANQMAVPFVSIELKQIANELAHTPKMFLFLASRLIPGYVSPRNT